MIAFKTNEVREEWAQLVTKNPRLSDLVIDLVHYIETMLRKDVMLTDVFRTQAEEAALYHTTEDKAIHSAHGLWKAIDLRSTIYTADEIRGISNYLTSQYRNKDGRPVVIYHCIPGNAPHMHIQLTD